MDGGFGRALDHQVEIAGLGEILGVAHIAMAELDPRGAQPGKGKFAAPPPQVVECHDRRVRTVVLEEGCEVRSNKPRPASHQDPHYTTRGNPYREGGVSRDGGQAVN